MPALTSHTLDRFARLIARGLGPIEAASRAGYRHLRRSAAAARLARPDAAARIAEISGVAQPIAATRRRAPDCRETEAPRTDAPKTDATWFEPPALDPPTIGRPILLPELTDEEWLAEYAPRPRGENGARPCPGRPRLDRSWRSSGARSSR